MLEVLFSCLERMFYTVHNRNFFDGIRYAKVYVRYMPVISFPVHVILFPVHVIIRFTVAVDTERERLPNCADVSKWSVLRRQQHRQSIRTKIDVDVHWFVKKLTNQSKRDIHESPPKT